MWSEVARTARVDVWRNVILIGEGRQSILPDVEGENCSDVLVETLPRTPKCEFSS